MGAPQSHAGEAACQIHPLSVSSLWSHRKPAIIYLGPLSNDGAPPPWGNRIFSLLRLGCTEDIVAVPIDPDMEDVEDL